MSVYTPTRIEVFRPSIGPAEQAAAAGVLASGWIGAGPRVAEFERAFAAHVAVPAENVFALSCATEALFQVFEWIADRCAGNEVVLPANAFIGAANAVIAAGLKPVLCDVDARSLNPTVQHVSERLSERAVAVLVQHFGGAPGDQELIADLCRAEGVLLVEDAACAPASQFYGVPSGTAGDFGVWSFDAMKVLTCGDGGLLYCRDAGVAAELRRAARLGTSAASGQANGAERWWEFTASQAGRRAQMNDIAAAIGLAQLGRVQELVGKRQAAWEQYQRQLADLPWLTLPPEPPPGARSSYYTYWVQCEARDALARFLRARGIYTTYRYWPVHRAYGWPADAPNAEWAADHTLLLPLHAELSESDVAYVCEQVREFGRD